MRSTWLERFGLPPDDWRSAAAGQAARLPFAEDGEILSSLEFLFGELPERLARSRSADYRRVAEAYGWLCFQAWQSASHFPAFAENYAEFLRVALRARRLPPEARVIAGLVFDGSGDGICCGFQRLALLDPALVRQSEVWLRDGSFEPFLKARSKYEEYERRLRTEPGFRRDWAALKRAFPRETSRPGILHRTLIPERNWVRDGGARFRTRAERFQAAFDLLCWKYCLWGVGRGWPLLLKPSVVVTPHGTQIFIPAYLSFDAKRDLDLGLITKLHRARGQPRQGERFAAARQNSVDQRASARAADREARAMKLKGDRRYAFICRRLGLLDHGDYRQLRRLLTGAKSETLRR